MAWSLVCPASRGIGFYLTRHLLQNTNIPVVATARSDVVGVKKNILEGLDHVNPERLNVLAVDVTGIFAPKTSLNRKSHRLIRALHLPHVM
jgi:hypothetical protein